MEIIIDIKIAKGIDMRLKRIKTRLKIEPGDSTKWIKATSGNFSKTINDKLFLETSFLSSNYKALSVLIKWMAAVNWLLYTSRFSRSRGDQENFV